MFHLVLVHPEIPHNTGSAGRLALATGSRLHLVKPLGFSLDEKQVLRAGLDYWRDVDLRVWENFGALQAEADPAARFWYLSAKAARSHWDASFRDGDYLVFGRETKGLPEAMVRDAGEQAIRIPMVEGGTRSLNLSTAVAITVYEALRQSAVVDCGSPLPLSSASLPANRS